MAFEPERPDRSRVVVADFLLLGIVAHALADVGFTVIAIRGGVTSGVRKWCRQSADGMRSESEVEERRRDHPAQVQVDWSAPSMRWNSFLSDVVPERTTRC